MNDRERITRLEIRCEQLQLTVNEAFHWIDILKSDLSDLQDRVGQADRKTEPQLTPNYCGTCKYREVPCGDLPCDVCHGYSNYEPKDEPQTYITEDRDTQILDAWQVHHRTTTSVEDEPQTERSE